MNFLVTIGDPTNDKVLEMIRDGDKYYDDLYPVESNHLMDIDSLLQKNVVFFIALKNQTICGFGAIVNMMTYGEIKRMYVEPSERGFGIGHQLLSALESSARQQGLVTLRLETGIRQPEAISLYKAHGYCEISAFGTYSPDPLSIFMEKNLTFS